MRRVHKKEPLIETTIRLGEEEYFILKKKKAKTLFIRTAIRNYLQKLQRGQEIPECHVPKTMLKPQTISIREDMARHIDLAIIRKPYMLDMESVKIVKTTRSLIIREAIRENADIRI